MGLDTQQGSEIKDWPKVAIIILNWNGWKDTIECLESLQRLTYPNYQIIVVDNGSTDGSVNQIKCRFDNIILIEVKENKGYSGGNNVGIKYAIKENYNYILILNNDTTLINPDFIQSLIIVMESDELVGIIGPMVLNQKNIVQKTILYTPSLINCIKSSFSSYFNESMPRNYSVFQEVEVVCGVCWLIRVDVVKQIGLLDEDYFMYVEEQDFCYRARKAGWKIFYYPIKSIYHKKEDSLEEEKQEKYLRQLIYTRRNIVLFQRKHISIVHALILSILFIASNFIKFILSNIYFYERNSYIYSFSSLLKLIAELKWALFKVNIHDQDK